MIKIESAVLSDSPFIAKAVCIAERAHTGTGIWDIVIDNNQVVDCLEHACVHDLNSHFNISHFIIARNESNGEPVAAACGFIYPNFTVAKSMPGITNAMMAICNWTQEKVDDSWKRISFLNESFPDFDYDNSWMLEAVYTDPNFRGRGLAAQILNNLIDTGRTKGVPKCLITCAVGNTSAFNLYTKLGFELVGTGSSDVCMAALNSPGFHLLVKYYN